MAHVVAVDPAEHAALKFATWWHATKLRQEWQRRRADAYSVDSAAERRQALADLHAERAERRTAGTWWDSQRAVLTAYLRTDLETRGWLGRSWRPVPHGEQHLPGRRVGVPSNPAGRWSARLVVDLPTELDRPLVRGIYWTSREPTRRLQVWLDAHPYPHSPLEQHELDERRAGITTTGDVLRDVLHTVAEPWFPRTTT